jgi:hypothetical protein
MRESVHVKVVFRAAEIRGGAESLSRTLGVSLSEVQSWMRSEAPVPDRVFAQLLDTIIDDTLRRLGNECRITSKAPGSPKP